MARKYYHYLTWNVLVDSFDYYIGYIKSTRILNQEDKAGLQWAFRESLKRSLLPEGDFDIVILLGPLIVGEKDFDLIMTNSDGISSLIKNFSRQLESPHK